VFDDGKTRMSVMPRNPADAGHVNANPSGFPFKIDASFSIEEA
jgi:hypothetical protein